MHKARLLRTFPLSGLLATAVLALPAGSPAIAPPAPKPPLAYTGYFEQVTSSSATLKAGVNPRGSATEYYFEYGPSMAYGSQTPSTSAGSGTQESKVAQAIAGLQPNTAYHYRVVASSSAGTAYGSDATLITKKIPLSLTVAATPNQAVFGSPLRFSGTLAGTGNAGAEIVLQANPYPYVQGFHNVGSPVSTDATGAFSFPIVDLLESAHIRAATVSVPAVHSPVVIALVTVRVTFHVRPTSRHGYVRLYGTITPSERGARVAFEWLDHAHRYAPFSGTTPRRTKTLRKTTASGVSRFARTVRLPHRGVYRAFVQVPAGGAQVSGYSRPILIR